MEDKVKWEWPLPHLRKGATFIDFPLIEKGKIYQWLKQPNNTYILMDIKRIERSLYFSDEIDSPDDAYFEFINFFVQKIEIFDKARKTQHLGYIINDIQNLIICLSKFNFYFNYEDHRKLWFYSLPTEIEYIVTVCRSLFDLLQEVCEKLFSKTEFILRDGIKRVNNLPSSFNDMCKNITTIEKKYNLPPEFIHFYKNNCDFFFILKEIRDSVIHSGSSSPLIFRTEKGFCFNYEDKNNFSKNFRNFNILKKENFEKNNLAPLLPVISFIIKQTLKATDDFTELVKKFDGLPEDAAPGYKLFLRHPFIKHYNQLDKIIENNLWRIPE